MSEMVKAQGLHWCACRSVSPSLPLERKPESVARAQRAGRAVGQLYPGRGQGARSALPALALPFRPAPLALSSHAAARSCATRWSRACLRAGRSWTTTAAISTPNAGAPRPARARVSHAAADSAAARQVRCGGVSAHRQHGAVRPAAGARLRAEQDHGECDVRDHAGDPSHCTCGVERRGEFSPLGPLAGCFLALGSGLRLVGTASSRR